MVGKMSKDIGMGVRKDTVVSFVLFGYFLGSPSLYVFSFFLMFFVTYYILHGYIEGNTSCRAP